MCAQAAGVTAPGQALLYFGCRKPDEDYLYQEDWQDFLQAGALSKLRVAFSRAQANKVSRGTGFGWERGGGQWWLRNGAWYVAAAVSHGSA